MSVVQPPYLLDFAQARLDGLPDFPEDVIDMWHAEKMEEFGDRWPEVETVRNTLILRCGVYLIDINPRNITFSEYEQ